MIRHLDTINLALEEIEEQLLTEFSRVRNTISEHRFEKFDTGIQVALESVVNELKDDLESTGNRIDLQQQTEHQENLSVRIVVLKKLLQTNVPTAYLKAAHDNINESRRKLENRVLANRTTAPNEPDKKEEEIKKTGFFGSIRGLFNREPNEQAADRNRISITAREADEAKEIEAYKDNGIYSASRELAVLANLMNTGSTLPSESLTGKASFESRELTKTTTKSGRVLAPSAKEILNQPADNVPASRRYTDPAPNQSQEEGNTELKASSADEIRSKLENRDTDTANENKGASVFQSQELSNPIPQVAQKIATPSISVRKPTPKRLPEKIDKTNLAQSPEAIRAKLEARKAESAVSGKASFQSKDVNHLQPQEYISRKVEKPDPAAQIAPAKPNGKAIFEAKELSNPPPKN